MRIVKLPMYPLEWADKAENIDQDRIVHRLYLGNERVRRVFYWHEPNGVVYIDVQMGPNGPLGTWHTYWSCYRFEWMRAMNELRSLYLGAAEAHEYMNQQFEAQLRAWTEMAKRDEPILVNWKKDGF